MEPVLRPLLLSLLELFDDCVAEGAGFDGVRVYST